jgi:hypothetical protein
LQNSLIAAEGEWIPFPFFFFVRPAGRILLEVSASADSPGQKAGGRRILLFFEVAFK